jgi:hypothetical protein
MQSIGCCCSSCSSIDLCGGRVQKVTEAVRDAMKRELDRKKHEGLRNVGWAGTLGEQDIQVVASRLAPGAEPGTAKQSLFFQVRLSMGIALFRHLDSGMSIVR